MTTQSSELQGLAWLSAYFISVTVSPAWAQRVIMNMFKRINKITDAPVIHSITGSTLYLL